MDSNLTQTNKLYNVYVKSEIDIRKKADVSYKQLKNYANRKRITCGWTIDPPAANEYAVLPEVVDKISPSPCTHVTKELSQ